MYKRAALFAFAAMIGGCGGYVACAIVANLEEVQFYTIRQWVTGYSAMSDIIDHPFDRFISPIIICSFVSAGIIIGILLLRRLTLIGRA